MAAPADQYQRFITDFAVRDAFRQMWLLAQRRQATHDRIELARLQSPPEIRHRVLAQVHLNLRQPLAQARERVWQRLHHARRKFRTVVESGQHN